MAYTKPQVIAQNASSGSYAAGCPANVHDPAQGGTNGAAICRKCELTA
ncbi:MAG: hypothetical protein K6A42_04400 [Treponema sp.]|nr:hypothetical protein [Treponema sp.]